MRFATRVFGSILCAGLAVLPASAQSMRIRPDGSVINSLQSNITFSMPFDESKSLDAQQDEATRSFYRYAQKSCQIALETIASSCELQVLSSNLQIDSLNRRGDAGSPKIITLNGQITMTVTFRNNTPQP